MNYTLHQLRIFLKIAENESVTKTAEELHLTQPAVSIQLKKLQDQFDIALTESIGRRIFVTDFGKEIASSAEKILEEADYIKHKTLAFKGHLVGSLKVSVVSTGKYVMPYFLSSFLKANPGIDLKMDVTNKAQVVRSLEENRVDFAIVSVLPNHLQIDREELMENRLFLVGKENVQSKGKFLSAKTIASLPLIYREPGSATRLAMEKYFSKFELTSNKVMVLTSNEAVKQAVIAGLGYSIMPLIGIKNALMNGDLKIQPVKDLPIVTNWNLIWLKGKNFSPIAQEYLSYLQLTKEELITQHFQWSQNWK